ncbi:MAG: hypothetical protein QF552_03230 [Litorilituus sp.]|jgi:hypothetical protein|nr:hypothetical protein [Litorilituus sp.]
MHDLLTHNFYLALAPWFVFAGLSVIAVVLMKFAKKRRGIAIAFAVLVQMFSPDPFVEKAITMVVSEKRAIKKQQEDGGKGKVKELREQEK